VLNLASGHPVTGSVVSRHRLGRAAAGVSLAIALGAPTLATSIATAAPIDDLRARAQQLEQDIAANGAHVAALGEQLNAAQLQLDEAQVRIDEATTRIGETKQEITRLEGLIDLRAVAIYQSAGLGTPLDILDVDDASETNTRLKYGEIATRRDHALVDELAAAREDLALQRDEAERARTSATTERDRLAEAKTEADAAAAEQQALLAQVEGEVGELVRQEQAARAASAAPASGKSTWSGPAPSPNGGAAAAVAFAQAQLGKPYEYAASGPDTYDCSGLTMRAWQAGGLSLPHYSGAQGSMFPRVPLDQLAPGDLITTSSWSAHIGIWVGGGFIHATHTGDVIKFVGGSGSVVDAVRPG
jgi:cell wall-associated NlpC family hydrolase